MGTRWGSSLSVSPMLHANRNYYQIGFLLVGPGGRDVQEPRDVVRQSRARVTWMQSSLMIVRRKPSPTVTGSGGSICLFDHCFSRSNFISQPEIGLSQHYHGLLFGCKIQGWLVVFVAVRDQPSKQIQHKSMHTPVP